MILAFIFALLLSVLVGSLDVSISHAHGPISLPESPAKVEMIPSAEQARGTYQLNEIIRDGYMITFTITFFVVLAFASVLLFMPGDRGVEITDGQLVNNTPNPRGDFWFVLASAGIIALLPLALTGPLMTQFYDPTAGGAYHSIQYINNEALLGWFVRGIHHWAGNILLISVLLHASRVVITAAYRKRQRIAYYAGVTSLATLIAMMTIGRIVKWDQEGYEALIHLVAFTGLSNLAGNYYSVVFTGGSNILSKIYSLHTGVMPLIIVAIVGLHLYLIRFDKRLAKNPRLLTKVGFGVVALTMVLALIFSVPFGIEPVNVETGVKPTWLFLWLYALENQLGLVGMIYGLGAVFTFLALLPVFERRLQGWSGRVPMVGLLIIVLLVLSSIGYLSAPVVHSNM